MPRLIAALLALLLQPLDARAEQTRFVDRAGDAYEIRLESVSETSGDGSSGSSRDVTAFVERVIALRDDGVELEFDLPEPASPEDRARTWQLPARVLKPMGRPFQLLNGPELEARVQSWLERAGLTEAACGHWVFTWTAIKIECDPRSVLEMLEAFDLRESDLRDGALHSETGARGSAPLRMVSRRFDGATFVVELGVDPELVRRGRAETDIAVAEMLGRPPLALEAALQAWSARPIAGTITTTFETDSVGRLRRRTRVINIEVIADNGSVERQTTTETVERRRVSDTRFRR